MPTLNGRPYHLTTTTIHPFSNEPSAFQTITTPPTPPTIEDTFSTTMASLRVEPTTSRIAAIPTTRARSGARHIPRIPRLRRPILLNDSQNSPERNDTTLPSPLAQPQSYNLPHMSISSAISTTTTGRRLHSPPSVRDQCLEPVDLSTLFAATHDYSSMTKQKEENYRYLDFQLTPQKSNASSSSFDVENFISYQHGALYRGFDSNNTINLALEYVGHRYSCVVAQIIIKSPQTGFSTPRRNGMVLISPKPFDIEETQQFNNFTYDDYERYQKDNKNHDDRIAAWFRIKNDQPIVVDLGERFGRYVLIKLFPAEHETASLDLQFIALLGYVGARSFVKAQLL